MSRTLNLLYQIRLALVSVLATLTLFILFSANPADAQGTSRLQLIQSTSDRVVLELSVDSYTSQTRNVGGRNYTTFSISDFGLLGDAGKPALPTKGVMLGIPPGAELTLRILADESRRDPLANPPIPAPTAQVDLNFRERNPRFLGNQIIPDQATYTANRFYPSDAARIASTGNWRSQRFVVVEFHPLQYNPATRELIFHRRLQVEITFTYPRGRTAQTLGGAVNEGHFEQVLRQSLLNYSSAQNWRSKGSVAPPARLPREYSGGPWFKIALNSEGIYRVTCPDLQTAGLNPATLDPNTLQLFDQGVELAVNVVGNTWNTSCTANDYIEFFGQGLNTEYTDSNVYWLTHSSTTGKRMPTRDGNVAGSVPATFTDTVHLEVNKYYYTYIPMNVENADHWYWDFASTAYGVPNRNMTVQLNRFATSAYSATLQYALGGWSTNNHHSRILVNGNLIDDQLWSGGRTVLSRTVTFSQSFLNAGANTITLNVPSDADANDVVLANYFKLSYQSHFTATNNVLKFQQAAAGTWQYQIGGFTNSTIVAFDITNPYSVTQIINTAISPSGPNYTLQFGDTIATPRTYIALTTSQIKTLPTTSITLDAVSNLRHPSNGADYIIISHGPFTSTLQSLATFRASQGLRVKVIDVQDVYDEFSDGSVETQAIRDFLAFAYANWIAPAPSLVLLVGDATLDPRGYCATPNFCAGLANGVTTLPNSTLLPPYLRMVDPWIGETVSDNRLVSFDDGSGNTLPFMAIGRLPANNTTEVNTMVSKILNYEQNPPAGNWRSRIAFVTDNAYDTNGILDGAGDFWAFSEAIANNPQYMPNGLLADRIYLNPCDGTVYPQCALPFTKYSTGGAVNAALKSAINSGRLIVSYIGHAWIHRWGAENIWITWPSSDANSLTNGNRLPVVLAMTCMDGYFLDPNYNSVAEDFIRAANKGAVASWSATGLGVAHGHDFLEKGFFNAVVNSGIRQLGPATLAGKTNLWANSGGSFHDLIDTYMLFGDPASRLQLEFSFPTYLPFIRKQ